LSLLSCCAVRLRPLSLGAGAAVAADDEADTADGDDTVGTSSPVKSCTIGAEAAAAAGALAGAAAEDGREDDAVSSPYSSVIGRSVKNSETV
jgi:hypothetical protein